MKKYIIGITGASGSILAKKLLEFLAKDDVEINIVITDTGEKVFEYETDLNFNLFIENLQSINKNIFLHNNKNMFSEIASGSNSYDGIIILPCSMASIGKFVNCTGDSLLCRVFDVGLKESTQITIVPRETPLSKIHLKNMLNLSDMGVKIVPPIPMFYNKPKDIEKMEDDIVGRILKTANIDNNLYNRWSD